MWYSLTDTAQPTISNIGPERYHYTRTRLYLPNPHFPRLNEILQIVGWAAVTQLSASVLDLTPSW